MKFFLLPLFFPTTIIITTRIHRDHFAHHEEIYTVDVTTLDIRPTRDRCSCPTAPVVSRQRLWRSHLHSMWQRQPTVELLLSTGHEMPSAEPQYVDDLLSRRTRLPVHPTHHLRHLATERNGTPAESGAEYQSERNLGRVWDGVLSAGI